ncbi:MAG: DNA gyrase subunit [Planctomycetota bacterium]|nr:MAG: DNA gyrase subunit [Planctomycetota bacterium]
MTPESDPKTELIRDLLIEEEMKDSYLNYAMSVIVSRALPDVRDGMKPSQRRIIVAMNDLGLGPRAKYKKCAKIVGETMGKYHPHGDQAIYPTMVRLAQNFASRYMLINGQGNFGSIDEDPPAAMRYTEARMSQFAALMLEDLDKGTVRFVPNYDETETEPSVLPSKFPNLLCNGSSGIAVGMATSIPPHNLSEVCDAIVRVIEEPEVSIADLMQIVRGPDFPTGGIICGLKGIRDAYETGRGSCVVRAKIDLEEDKRGRRALVVTEIPYNVSKKRIIERVAELHREGRIQGISDLRDESDKDGMRLVIDLKKDADDLVVLNQLYRSTPLQDTFSIIMIALVKERPQTLSLKDFLVAYKDHRIEVIRRRTKFLLDRAEAEAHILEGLLKAIDVIDEVIAIIRSSPDVPTAEKRLIDKYKFTVIQAQAILRMTLAKLTGLEREKLQKELAALHEKIAEYRAILADERLVLDIIREDLIELKSTLGDKRRTEIAAEVGEFVQEDLIPDDAMVVSISREGYVKRVPVATYKRQGRGGKGVIGADMKEGDFIERLFVATNHETILFFTDQGRVHWLKVYELPQLSRTSKGRAMVNLLQVQPGEAIQAAIPIRDFTSGYIVMATRKGTVKKTALDEFSNVRKGGIIAIKLDEGDRLIGVQSTSGEEHVILGTRLGRSIRFPEKHARPMGRATYGSRGIRLRDKDFVIDMVIVPADLVPPGADEVEEPVEAETSTHESDPPAVADTQIEVADDADAGPEERLALLTVCENGFGKRTPFREYRTQARGGMGIINIRASERNGPVVSLKAVSLGDDIVMITQQGMVVRTNAGKIKQTRRAAQGVRVIGLNGNDKLVSIAVIREEEQAAPAEAAAAAPAPPAASKGGSDDKKALDELVKRGEDGEDDGGGGGDE